MNRIISPENMASVQEGCKTSSLPTENRLLSFKERRSFESRKKDVVQIRKKHPNKIPIIIEKSQNEKTLAELDKSKFLVPEELTMSQLVNIIRLRLRLRESQAFYMIIGKKTMVSNSLTLGEIYNAEKESDGFIYMTYASQEVFG